MLIQSAVRNKLGTLLSGITGKRSFYAWRATATVKVKVNCMLGEILYLTALQQLWSHQLCVIYCYAKEGVGPDCVKSNKVEGAQ